MLTNAEQEFCEWPVPELQKNMLAQSNRRTLIWIIRNLSNTPLLYSTSATARFASCACISTLLVREFHDIIQFLEDRILSSPYKCTLKRKDAADALKQCLWSHAISIPSPHAIGRLLDLGWANNAELNSVPDLLLQGHLKLAEMVHSAFQAVGRDWVKDYGRLSRRQVRKIYSFRNPPLLAFTIKCFRPYMTWQMLAGAAYLLEVLGEYTSAPDIISDDNATGAKILDIIEIMESIRAVPLPNNCQYILNMLDNAGESLNDDPDRIRHALVKYARLLGIQEVFRPDFKTTLILLGHLDFLNLLQRVEVTHPCNNIYS